MTSAGGDLNTPDLLSDNVETEGDGDGRFEKDSSNDGDMFEDSSGEESQATLNLNEDPIEGMPDTAPTEEKETSSNKPKQASKSETAWESIPLYADGEDSLMIMSDEEKEYFERYKDANQAQLTSLKCTICSCQLFLVNPENIKIHPALGVLVCKNCREFYSNGPFTKDEDGHDEYCRWCAEGGMMICCDTCSNVFCKACLRRCVGRLALLEITNSKCNWSCLVCNNLPLWAQRALSRMVLISIRSSFSGRKSLSGKSLLGSPSSADTKDPAVWLPAIISEAEKLATYCKVLATKVGNNWNKDGAPVNGDESSSSRQERDLNKFKVIDCCRKLRKAVVTTQLNMKLLEKKLVSKFEQKYGNTSEIEVETTSETSTSVQGLEGRRSPRMAKRLIVKIKNFREANRKQDFYAEIRNSPVPSPRELELSQGSQPKSAGSLSSLATIPVSEKGSPSRAEEKNDDDYFSALPKLHEDNKAQDYTSDENDRFFDTCSELLDDTTTNVDESPSTKTDELDPINFQTDPFDSITKQPNESTDIEDQLKSTAPSIPVKKTPKKSPNNINHSRLDAEKQEKICDSALSTHKNETDGASPSLNTPRNRLTLVKTKGNEQIDVKPVATEKTPSSNQHKNRSPPSHTDVETSTSSMDLNEKARLELLKYSSDSDDSLAEIKLSPRVKRTKKRIHVVPTLGFDDPKLRAECAVVINRITNLNEALALENGRKSEMKETDISRQIDRLVKSPIKLTRRSHSALSQNDSDNDLISEGKKPVTEKSKSLVDKKKRKSKTFRLEDLESSSDSDTDRPPEELPRVAEAPITLPDCNEAVRQALLASSDSENDFDMDTSESAKTADSEAKKPLESDKDEAMDVKDNDDAKEIVSDSVEKENDGAEEVVPGSVEIKEENDDINNDEDDVLPKSNVKTSKLLRGVTLIGPADESDGSKSAKETKGEKKKKERKKRRINSDSDFESSDSEKKNKKKSKRKRPNKSETEEISDEDDSSGEAKSKPKSRRRIKKVAPSDSEQTDDSDIQVLNESLKSDAGGSKGRKNIKKIIKDTNLKDETKAAAKEEEDRKKRIADRQKFYNEAFVGDMALINAQIDHLVLDFDPVTKEELVTVDKRIVTKLKPHQVKGVKFMWEACFESIERIKEHPGSGCILAHCMGLGKSLQVVTLTHTVLTHKACQVDRVLVVCPLSTVLNWVNEFNVWLPKDTDVEVYELASVKGKDKDYRVYTLKSWFEGGGVLIIGYDMYRNLTNETNKRIKGKARDVFMRSLVKPGPQLVICDEGHLLKNETTALSKAMNRIETRRRVVLTGTPLQNSLLEYHCMIQFVKPNLLGTKKEFTNRFANPIKNGQAADSTDTDVRVMKRRAHVLHKMLQDSVQRFDYAVLTPFLPPKHEYVVSVKMSELQIKMYQYYLEHHAKGGPGNVSRGKGAGLFADFQALGRVWTHPKALLLADLTRESKAKTNSDSEGSLADFIDDRADTPSDEDAGVVCLDESDEKSDDEPAVKTGGWRSRTRAGRGDQAPPEDELGVTVPSNGSWWSQFVTEEDFIKIEHSGKLILLMDILRQCELIGDKVLVFSQSLVSLNLIEEFLAFEDQQNEKNRSNIASELKSNNADPIGTWRLGADYFRLDGQTSPELRKNWCNSFNNPSNLRSRLFLISTKAGGLGINLVAANRVIIFDASWNPSHDVQSIFRVYRFGQKKPCYIYRFLAQGTMEEKIYDRQVTKLSLSCRVVDEQQIERHFNSADLNELYMFEPDSHLRRPTPLLPKDRLLAELTIQRKDWIVTYHEHDSLLENKSEEELSEAERKAAWDDFENEKRGVNTMGMMMHDSPGFMGMPGMPDILAGLAGRSVAGIPLSSIAAMIYNSNPGISQDEFLGRLRLTVDQLQNFSVQQAAAAAAASAAASAQNNLQQPGDAQRLLMQRQVAADQLKRQFGNPQMGDGLAGPSGVGSVPQPRSRGRPTIGPHQRTDLYGLGPVLSNSTPSSTPPAGQSGSNYPS